MPSVSNKGRTEKMISITVFLQEDVVCWDGLPLETREPCLRLFTMSVTDQSVTSWREALRFLKAMGR